MVTDEIKRFKYETDILAFVHLMFTLTCGCNGNVHRWNAYNLGH